jgi:SAM-dependent methyltransferase
MGQDPKKALTAERGQTWDKIHRVKSLASRPDDHLIAFLDFLGTELEPGARVLDAGCGKGRHAGLLRERGYNFWGCDISGVAVQKASHGANQPDLGNRFHVADLRELPYRDGSIEAVICVHTLPYHLRLGMVAAVTEFIRVLSPGGWLYADLLDVDDSEFEKGPNIEKYTYLDSDGTPVHFSNHDEIEKLFSSFRVHHSERVKVGIPQNSRVAWIVWAQMEP